MLAWPIRLLPPMGMATVSVIGIGVGFGLIIMARGLRHRKLHAWWAVVILLSIGIVIHLIRAVGIGVHLIHHIAPLQTGISVAVVVVLVLARKEFPGHDDPRSRRSVPLIFVGMVLACWGVGALLTLADGDDIVPGWTPLQLLHNSLIGLVGLPGPLAFTTQAATGHNVVELLGLGVLVVVVTVVALLRSAPQPVGDTAAQQDQIRALLDNVGGDSLGYFSLRHDKSYVFSPSGKAAIAYRVISGVCLASGDPIGDIEAWPGATRAWLSEARRQAWLPAVLAVSETGAQAYQRAGLDCLEIGDEAIVDVADFTLDGRAMRSVRQAVTRARKAGHITTITTVGDLAPRHALELTEATEAWRAGGERGFSMALSRFASAEDARSVVVEAHSSDDKLEAVLQVVPWGRDGWSLDLMRRHPDLDSGVMEMMISDLIAHGRRMGITEVSLNFAFFRSSLARSERVGAGPVLRVWVAVLLFASRWFQIASLYRANAKFRPGWEPRFLSFVNVSDLGQIAVAALRAEGFLALPHFPQLLPGHRRIARASNRSSLATAQPSSRSAR